MAGLPGVTHAYIGSLGNLTVPRWVGVFPCDMLPTSEVRMKHEARLMINTATSEQSAGHFVAVYKQDGVIVYFDPLGLPHPNMFIQDFVHQLSTDARPIINKDVIQHPQSQCCGFFCLSFLLHTQINCESPLNICKSFAKEFISPPVLKNDIICASLLQNQIHKS